MKELALKYIYRKLAWIATEVVNKHQPFVIAVTGSVGKTSTKEAIASVLQQKFPSDLRYTHGNLNAEIGIPLTILGYSKQPSKKEWPLFLLKIKKHLLETKYPKYLILEMGVEHPGDIKSFCKIAKPDIGVITAATPSHLANFSSLDQLKKEKFSLSENLKENGTLVLNYDDEYLVTQGAKCLSYSATNLKADILAKDIEINKTGNKYTLVANDNKVTINSELIGSQMILADLAATAVAQSMHLELDIIKSGLEKRQPYPGRFNYLPGRNDWEIIDDTYNANPASVMAAADNFAAIPHSGRKVFVLGNMNELGSDSEKMHIDVASYIDGKSDLIILAGPNAEIMAQQIHQSDIMVYENRRQIEDEIEKIFNPGDLILVKASQNKNYFEELVKKLLKDDIDPHIVLVRQGKEWDGKKSKF